MRRLSFSCRLLAFAMSAASIGAGLPRALAAESGEWSTNVIRQRAAWSPKDDAQGLAVVDGGLKVAVTFGRTWQIAAASGYRLPRDAGTLRVTVAELGGGGEWFLRLFGDVRGDGKKRTVQLFQDDTRTGAVELPLDPRLPRLAHEPRLQIQLGIKGKPGAFAVFSALEFLPRESAVQKPAGRSRQPGQRDIECVTFMPNQPRPYKMLDWRAKARAYDRFVFDFNAKGQYLPLIWLDDSRVNIDRPAFGLTSYAGDPRGASGPRHESVTCLGAVLGATLAGIDKSKQAHNYVEMCEAYFNSKNGERLVLNGVSARSGGSFWYEIWPHVVFYALADRYPDTGRLTEIMKITATRWNDAVVTLHGPDGIPNFDYTAFRFRDAQPVDNGRWREPDAAAGVAWLEYMAYVKFGDEKFLQAADECLRFLQRREENPYYEVLMPYGALVAARMNAERGRDSASGTALATAYDVDKLVNWCFGISDCRGGWGVIAQRWGDHDCHGLLGSVDNRGGYAFAMNTFAQAGALVPLARYDDGYARAIGKWMLNLANAARLFYPEELPPGHESCAHWKGDPGGVIAYEGLRHHEAGKRPRATGDPVPMKWGPATNRGLYGSSYAGILGAIVRTTDVEGILQLDCLATDYFHAPAFPTYLYYNPHAEKKEVTYDAGPTARDLYDACTGKFLLRNAKGKTTIPLPPDSAILLVSTPANGKLTRQAAKTSIDGVVVDYIKRL